MKPVLQQENTRQRKKRSVNFPKNGTSLSNKEGTDMKFRSMNIIVFINRNAKLEAG